MRSRLTDMFGIDVPIFAFTHKPEVAIEVTNAGGMGALAASYYQPDELERILTDMDEKTLGRPYCIDVLFANKVGEVVPMSERLKALPKEHIDFVEKILDDAGIPPLPPEVEAELLRDKPPGRGHTEEGILEVLEVVVKHPQARFVLSAMGAPPAHVVETLHRHGIKVGAMAGSAEHALKHIQAGVDLVVAQGSEAGGHTGTISSMVLWPEVVDAIAPVPVLAAGGVGSGRHIAAAFALGADAKEVHRRALTGCDPTQIRHGQAPSGTAQQVDRCMGRARSAAPASTSGPKASCHPCTEAARAGECRRLHGLYVRSDRRADQEGADHPRDCRRHEDRVPGGHG
jgi:NAD(P)H-dependent flavin oxidoreductase YrpB (nitropropane dioxygenase family)